MKMAHAEVLKIVPVLAPQDIAAVATKTSWVDTDQCVGLLQFEIAFGAITATDSSTSEMAVTVLASTSGGTDSTASAIAFSYQLSSAIGADSMGAVTAATSSGIKVNSATGDNKLLVIYVDPAVMKAVGTDYRWAYVNIDGTAGVTAALISGVAHFTPRYSQASQLSST